MRNLGDCTPAAFLRAPGFMPVRRIVVRAWFTTSASGHGTPPLGGSGTVTSSSVDARRQYAGSSLLSRWRRIDRQDRYRNTNGCETGLSGGSSFAAAEASRAGRDGRAGTVHRPLNTCVGIQQVAPARRSMSRSSGRLSYQQQYGQPGANLNLPSPRIGDPDANCPLHRPVGQPAIEARVPRIVVHMPGPPPSASLGRP